MASAKQNQAASKINMDRAQATFNRRNFEYQADPDDPKKMAAYRTAKTKLAEARSVWRIWRPDTEPGENDAIAKPPTIAARASVRKGI
jgi:hypothetical protein